MPSQPSQRPPAERPIRLVVFARLRLYREGLAQLLDADPRVTVVGTAGALEEATACAFSMHPDVAVLDFRGAEGHATVRALAAGGLDTRVVAIAVHERDAEVVGWAEAGIAGYVTRDESLVDLLEVIVGAARGELRCTPRIAAALLRRVAAGPSHDTTRQPGHLTPRETQIVRLMAEGLANKEIAARLRIGRATVKNHVHNILEKVGAKTRAEAAAVVRRYGLVAVPESAVLNHTLESAARI